MPGESRPLAIARPVSLAAVEHVFASKRRQVLLVPQRDAAVENPTGDDLLAVGTVASVDNILRLPDGRCRISVTGLERVTELRHSSTREGFLRARGYRSSATPSRLPTQDEQERIERAVYWLSLFRTDFAEEVKNGGFAQRLGRTSSRLSALQIVTRTSADDSEPIISEAVNHLRSRAADEVFAGNVTGASTETLSTLFGLSWFKQTKFSRLFLARHKVEPLQSGVFQPASVGELADYLLRTVQLQYDAALKAYEIVDPSERLHAVMGLIEHEAGLEIVGHEVRERAMSNIRESQRVEFLREQLRVIVQELGEDAAVAIQHSVFRGRGFRKRDNYCFVLMPFDEQFRAVFTDIIRPVAERFGLVCLRADDIYGSQPIIEDIWRQINEARLLIADLTGKNPNVFYEVGLAHAIGKDVVIVSRSLEDIPFDLRHLRCIIYSDSVAGFRRFERDLVATIASMTGREQDAPNS